MLRLLVTAALSTLSITAAASAKPTCMQGSIDVGADLGVSEARCVETSARKATMWDARAICNRERKHLCAIEELMAATAYPEVTWNGCEWLGFEQASPYRMMTFSYDKANRRQSQVKMLIYWGEANFRCCFSEN
ncbi:MAG: hypothetical protein EOP06_08770 [Proteobacteria bacterium]|nr:MAG: hypothetical protein EOP06_08770 [Pseudomonadota bacterium]